MGSPAELQGIHRFIIGRYTDTGRKILRQLHLSEDDAVQVLADMMGGRAWAGSFFIGTMPWSWDKEESIGMLNTREDLFDRAMKIHASRRKY